MISNRIKLYYDSDCTKQVPIINGTYVFDKTYSSTINRTVTLDLYAKNTSEDKIHGLTLLSPDITLDNTKDYIDAGEVINLHFILDITKYDKIRKDIVTKIEHNIFNNTENNVTYQSFKDTKLKYIDNVTYSDLLNNKAIIDIPMLINIVTPIYVYETEIKIIGSYDIKTIINKDYETDIKM